MPCRQQRSYSWQEYLVFCPFSFTHNSYSERKSTPLTVKFGKVAVSQNGGYPQFLRIYVGTHKLVARRGLHHRLQLAPYAVSLRRHNMEWTSLFVCLLLFSVFIATLFQLYHGSDMMYEITRTMHELTLLPTQWICAAIHFPTLYNLQRHQRPVPFIPCLYGVISYTEWGNELQHSLMLWQQQDSYLCPQGHQFSVLTHWAISPPTVVNECIHSQGLYSAASLSIL